MSGRRGKHGAGPAARVRIDEERSGWKSCFLRRRPLPPGVRRGASLVRRVCLMLVDESVRPHGRVPLEDRPPDLLPEERHGRRHEHGRSEVPRRRGRRAEQVRNEKLDHHMEENLARRLYRDQEHVRCLPSSLRRPADGGRRQPSLRSSAARMARSSATTSRSVASPAPATCAAVAGSPGTLAPALLYASSLRRRS